QHALDVYPLERPFRVGRKWLARIAGHQEHEAEPVLAVTAESRPADGAAQLQLSTAAVCIRVDLAKQPGHHVLARLELAAQAVVLARVLRARPRIAVDHQYPATVRREHVAERGGDGRVGHGRFRFVGRACYPAAAAGAWPASRRARASPPPPHRSATYGRARVDADRWKPDCGHSHSVGSPPSLRCDAGGQSKDTAMTPGLSPAERAMLERAHRQRYKLSRAPRFQPPPPPPAPSATAGPGPQRSSRGRLLTLAKPPFAVRMLNRMSYGATPQSVAEFNALGGSDTARLTAWVDRQLSPASINDSAVDARLAGAGYTTLGKSLAQQWADHVRAPDLEWAERIRPGTEAQRECLVRAVYSNRQLFEVATMFWHDHFNVMVSDGSIAQVFGHYSRDVIRANAFGNFRTMLEAVAQSPAMMYYLDNRSNSRSGPNENFARELLELHTLGAENYLGFMDPFKVPPCPEDPSYPIGYTDIDVYETAAAFTGWTINDGRNGGGDDGSFRYYPAWHDSGPKFVLGTFIYPERPALQDGRDILDRLAS